MIDSCHDLGLGHGSRVMRVAESQSGEAIGFRQLLYATLFDTVEMEIAINYFVYSQSSQ